MRRIVTGDRLAIRHGDVLLAVPPIPSGTSRDDRIRILEYVLRRQPGLAHTHAHILDEERKARTELVGYDTIAALISERPNHVGRAA